MSHAANTFAQKAGPLPSSASEIYAPAAFSLGLTATVLYSTVMGLVYSIDSIY